MTAACVEPLPLYRPRDPQASDLWQLLEQHFETFQQVYDERFAAKYGFWRPIVERSVKAFLKCGDLQEGVGYMTRCPFSLSRLVKVSETGQVIYKAEKGACRAFPDPQRDELARGPQRNFQILDPLEFVAEFTRPGVPGAPIPPQGAHLIRGHRPKVGRGWYSNKARGMRRKAAEAAEAAAATLEPPAASSSGDAGPVSARSRSSQTWAMLIKRLYEIDQLACPECGGQMKVVAFLEPRAPERSDGRGT